MAIQGIFNENLSFLCVDTLKGPYFFGGGWDDQHFVYTNFFCLMFMPTSIHTYFTNNNNKKNINKLKQYLTSVGH